MEILKMEGGKKLNKSLTIRLSEKEYAFLDQEIHEIYKRSDFIISKATLIRRYCTRAFICIDGDEGLNTQYKLYGQGVHRAYNFSGVKKLKNESLKKTNRGEHIDEHLQVNKVFKMKISEDDLELIKEKRDYAKSLTGVDMSMGDFIRFCINAEMQYRQLNNNITEESENNHESKYLTIMSVDLN